jgi:hypothetical protein
MKLVVSMALAAALLVSGRAHAQSCSTWAADRVNWLTATAGNYLALKGTSINSPAASGYGLVSYVEGYLDSYSAAHWIYNGSTFVLIPASASSHANYQSFSDRYATGYQPFSVSARDQLGITLDTSGRITITLDSWGGGALSITATQCLYDTIYGFDNGGTLWSFDLKKTWLG